MKKPRLIDLNEAIQHPGRHVEYEVTTELDEEQDLDLLTPITCTLDAVSTGNILLVEGEFSARVIQECIRCLGPVESEVMVTISEEFEVEGTPAELDGNSFAHVEFDEPAPMFDGNSLYFEELIRQNLLVNLPNQPLCSVDCPGIEHLEDGPTARPEFEALKQLRLSSEDPS